jgi:hypothetical protein
LLKVVEVFGNLLRVLYRDVIHLGAGTGQADRQIVLGAMTGALGALAARFATTFEAFDQGTAENERFEPPELLDQSLASLA